MHWSSKEGKPEGRARVAENLTFALSHGDITSPFASTNVLTIHWALSKPSNSPRDTEASEVHDESVCAQRFDLGREASTVVVHLHHGIEHNGQRIPRPSQPGRPREISSAEDEDSMLPSYMPLALAHTDPDGETTCAALLTLTAHRTPDTTSKCLVLGAAMT